jgi:NAD(P) transhydrogenase subunit alpha
MPIEEETVADNGYAKQVSLNTQEKIHQVLTEPVKRADVIITTAQIPGKQAPLLVTAQMLAQMKPGSVIIDLAAEQGGNCAHTEAGKTVTHHGVTIVGSVNLPASVPTNASQVYGKNLQTLVQYLVNKEGEINLNLEDDIIQSACVTHNRAILNQRVKEALLVVSH